ncbi:unnamed protein product [Blepharisma stoltei]|uniref:Voltage-dependent anion-selective channel protein 3 n=1 Tax=Blepharisma stoltei TaxID=1481888 RepID=A0AAU9J8W2_9CILI|nr:unnamed protein product [Blepharisma stoltei]
MVKLENYTGLTKKQEDLLKKGYCHGSLALLNFNLAQTDFTWHTRASYSKNGTKEPIISSWIQFKQGLASWKAKKRTDGLSHFVFDWTPKDYVANLKLKTECKTQKVGSTPQTEPSFAVEYTHPKAIGKLVFLGAPLVVKGSLTLGTPAYGLGLDGKFSTQSQKLTAYNLAAWWFRKHSRLVVKHVGTNTEEIALGNLELSYYHKLSPKVHVATKVTNELKGKATNFEIGGDYKLDDKTLVKAKAGTCGSFALGLARQLSDNLKLTLSTGLDSKAITACDLHDFKFGFRFDYSQ